ncbi:hypothetical protein FDC35_13395 [Clostridium botulinum]|nr:hypothetical protein [Clostridium botulinum]NFP01846.1 hypothetical protein [Clostridium botulinum]
MENFTAEKIINGRFYSLWIDGDQYAEVRTASAESALETDKVPIAGQLGNEEVVRGANGTGSLGFHKTYNGLLKKINESIKEGKAFVFDLISELNDPNQSAVERVMIEDCKITKFKVIDADITKLLESNYDFSYNPNKVTFE